jgi:flagellar export protein FliJ
MKGILSRLQSIREIKKKQAWMDLVEAERLREQQHAHLQALESEVAASRDVDEEEQACWEAQRHSWCLQMEMKRRLAEQTLVKYTTEREERRSVLEAARREVRIVELVLERIELEEAAEERRQEIRDNDEIATISWCREVV